jgi:Spx/MgsR family transcriptional regulator
MSASVTMYGISNCDTIKKAKTWLQTRQIDFEFHDYRKQGLEPSMLGNWVAALGWEVLINKRGTSWRKLSVDTQQTMNQDSALKVMLENPAIIKRPLLIVDGIPTIGFSDESYSSIFT